MARAAMTLYDAARKDDTNYESESNAKAAREQAALLAAFVRKAARQLQPPPRPASAAKPAVPASRQRDSLAQRAAISSTAPSDGMAAASATTTIATAAHQP